MAVISRRLTDVDPTLDRDPGLGQVSLSYRFDLVDGVTGEVLLTLHPSRDAAPTLQHDTGRTIKRSLANLTLDASESPEVDPLVDRVLVTMVLGDGREFPLGRYMWTAQVGSRFTSGVPSTSTLVDEAFVLDQETSAGFDANPSTVAPGTFDGLPDIDTAIKALVSRYSSRTGVQIEVEVESSGLLSFASWPAGTSGAKILDDLAQEGGFFSPWFDHSGILRFIRVFEPADEVPDVDLDAAGHVIPSSIAETSDVLAAPNRFTVISNGANTRPVVGTYDVPDTAPHSIVNRGFVINETHQLAVTSVQQANGIARTIGIASTVYERTTLSTTPDPRFDSYTVVRWRGSNWLSLAWDLPLVAGGQMRHTLRKAYAT